MTARQLWEGLLTELSKVNAPSMLLQDFNYFINKAVNLYINKRYNIYDINQQTTDDLRVLKATTLISDPEKVKAISGNSLLEFTTGASKLFGATYFINLPLDYLHMLNCICIYKVKERYKCYDQDDFVQFAAKRLTGDSWSSIMNDYYNRPLPQRPYYYINNVNSSNELPTNPIPHIADLARNSKGTDPASTAEIKLDFAAGYEFNGVEIPFPAFELIGDYEEDLKSPLRWYDSISEGKCLDYAKKLLLEMKLITEEDTVSSLNLKFVQKTYSLKLPRTLNLKNFLNKSVVEREEGVRYGNSSAVRCEIRYGLDDSVFELVGVMVDYIKAPQTIRLTLELVNLTKDTSLILEFPDYVCLEIINELVTLVMENIADPRLLTHSTVTQTIANPVQQLPQPKKA